MKGLISLAVGLSLVALACGDATVDTAGGADPPPGTATTVAPPTTPPPTTAPPPPPDGSVRVAITGTLTPGPDGLVEVCKPGEVEGCFGVAVAGDLGDAVIGDPALAHRVVGDYDGRTVALIEPPVPVDRPGLGEVDFSTPCEGLTGSGGSRAVEPVQLYATGADGYAGSWWDNDAGVFTVWFVGDDVSAHEAAIEELRGDGAVCVIGGADYTDAELRAAQVAVVDELAAEIGMSAAWGDTLRNRVVVDAEHVDLTLLARIQQIHPGIEVLAFLEVLDGSVADLPPPAPIRPGDVPLVTAEFRARGGMDALGFFTLRFDADLGCFFLEGDEGTRWLPVWPLGFSGDSGPPAQVFDRDGEVYATAGDQLEVGGGGGAPAPADQEGCGAANTWVLNI